MLRTRSLGVVAAVVALASGCGSSGPAKGTTPKDHVRGDAQVLSVAYPKDWQAGPDQSVALSRQAPDRTAFLEVVKDVSTTATADQLSSLAEMGPQLQTKGYRRTDEKKIDVAGAKAAERLDFTFDGFAGTANAPGQGVFVAVLGGDRHAHLVRITFQRGKLSDGALTDIVSSIKVGS
ncbi:hypothetical protein DZF91_09290 [Actinomadura logoneensis]|uniref:Lipoprotein n=1 Tax=Actinomadura logoneensis TaxID=2293572 RepID=A0A372JPG6_9ACTN|nr:hypothetical protein [Actinomadura logoneensis]RFU41921.1 hypothetical protein DZF91_09290 [Actinomadura logoneensis]